MIKVYADDQLVYAPNLDDYVLQTLQVTVSATTSGTATITMPPGHPAINSFVNYKTIVTVYRDDALLFRGRVLFVADDFFNFRTVTCEGERGFLQDSIVRPYLYQDSPANIFTDLITLHNSQVEASKAFVVGEVTVEDENDYIRLESTMAEQTVLVLDKLVERVGGYLVFTTNNAGQRVINWYAEPGYRSGQVIESGENLLDFTKTGISTDLATIIIPYGAEDVETGERVTIESVNDGLYFIQDDEAVAIRGRIVRAVYWDDVTDPANLLRKAWQYLNHAKNVVTSLQLSAVDLSVLDRDIDTFQVFDRVRVRSKPHNLDEDFMLTDRSYDLLQPELDTVVLGKEAETLTGSDAAGDRNAQNTLQKTEILIRAEYQKNIAQVVQETKETLISLIQQTEEAIKLEVSESYATNGEVDSKISTSMTQLSDSFTFLFSTLESKVDENDAETRAQFAESQKYIRFKDGNILLGEENNTLELKIQKDRISFYDDGAEVAYFSNKQLVVLDGYFLKTLRIGDFAFLPRDNGNLSLVKVG